MVRHCNNPACRIEFTLFRSGYLYAHERQFADTEFVWLCSRCGSEFVPYLDAEGLVAVTPRSDRRSLRPPRADGYLRLVAAPNQRNPWSTSIPAGMRQPDPAALQWKEGPQGCVSVRYKSEDVKKSSAA